MFSFVINTTSTTQLFITFSGNPLIAFPKQAIEVSQIYGDIAGVLQPINSFLDYLDEKKIRRFYIARSYAAGDILMLGPIIRELKKQGYSAYLRTTKTWKPLLDLLDIEIQTTEQNLSPTDWGINLDGTLEADHYKPALSEMHRCEIYAETLGMKRIKKLDWSMDLGKLPKMDIEKNYVAIQLAGSTKMKQLPASSIDYIKKRFEEEKIKVVMIGEEDRKPVEELFAIIKGAKCLICMDSAPLWCSHYTRTSIIGLFGPTRPSERIVYHPLYSDGAVGIRLNKEIDCESCFEQCDRCGGRIDCFKIEPKRIWDLVYPKVKELMGKHDAEEI